MSKLPLSQLMSTTLSEWLEATVRGVGVRKTLQSLARLSTYSDNASAISAGAALAQLILAQQGVMYLHHGWHQMVKTLSERIASCSELRFNSLLESIKQHDGSLELRANGLTRQFDSIFLCVPPEQVNELIPGAIAASEMENIVSSKVACLDVCLKRLPEPKNTFAIGIDEPLYYSVHSAAAKLAPDGGALIHAAFYLTEDNKFGAHEQRLERMLDQLQPGWRQELVFKRFLPHMVASYGTPLAKLAGGSGLASPALAKHPNVFVCGDFVGNSAQLADCAVKSALAAVDMLNH